jgi:DNA-binding GntR family transcriptional regulator
LLKRDPDKAEKCIKKHLEFGLSRAKKYARIDETQGLVRGEDED